MALERNRLDESLPSHGDEGKLTKMVEYQTSRVPSMVFLGLAVGSIAASAGFEFFSKRKDLANFVGMWAPTFLLMGIYNKLVKQQGSERWG